MGGVMCCAPYEHADNEKTVEGMEKTQTVNTPQLQSRTKKEEDD